MASIRPSWWQSVESELKVAIFNVLATGGAYPSVTLCGRAHCPPASSIRYTRDTPEEIRISAHLFLPFRDHPGLYFSAFVLLTTRFVGSQKRT